MAQTEEMKRLLLKGKIMGYEYHCNGEIYHNKDILEASQEVGSILILEQEYNMSQTHPNYIEHDSSELGIKVSDEWWFVGDIVESDWCNGAIIFDGFALLIDCDTQYSARLLNAQSNIKRIGNIHDNKAEE